MQRKVVNGQDAAKRDKEEVKDRALLERELVKLNKEYSSITSKLRSGGRFMPQEEFDPLHDRHKQLEEQITGLREQLEASVN
jgi:predicted  nucleic acid-binding Zn-ribbon protein